MGKLRGVRQEQDRLNLSEGDFIDVKRHLTVGESRDIAYLGMERIITEDGLEARPKPTLPFMAAATYILGWSLVDYDGQPIPWPVEEPIDARVAVLRSLDAETMNEIDEALNKHRGDHLPKKSAAPAAQRLPETSGSETPSGGDGSAAT